MRFLAIMIIVLLILEEIICLMKGLTQSMSFQE